MGKVSKLIAANEEELDVSDIQSLIDALEAKKRTKDETNRLVQNELLKSFLSEVRKQKEEESFQLHSQLSLIHEDLERVRKHTSTERLRPGEAISRPSLNPSSIAGTNFDSFPSTSSTEKNPFPAVDPNEPSSSGLEVSMFNERLPLQATCVSDSWQSLLSHRKNKMLVHFKELKESYLNFRLKSAFFHSSNSEHFDTSNSEHFDTFDSEPFDTLDQFADTLNKFTSYNSLRPLATLNYTSDPFSGSSIVSSIEFDKDSEFFAIAGVTKKIKLFEFSSVVKDSLGDDLLRSGINEEASRSGISEASRSRINEEASRSNNVIHYPVNEMECTSKISCVSFSNYMKSMMVSSDYDGIVTLWDSFTGKISPLLLFPLLLFPLLFPPKLVPQIFGYNYLLFVILLFSTF